MAPPLSSRSSNCFGGIVFTHLAREVRTIEQAVGKEELLVCGHRLFRAIAVIQEASVAHFLQRMRVKLAQREERLRGFNRALTHEFKNQIGALLGAADLLDLSGVADAERSRVADIVRRNATAMRTTLDNLVELSRVEREVRQHRWVMLPEAVAEAVRHLRDTAAHAGVEIRVCRLPAIEVPAAAVELAVANYLTNAVKYRDPAASRSWVDVRGRTAQSGPNLPPEIVIEVWDNGLGVPSPMRSQLFRARLPRARGDGDGGRGDGPRAEPGERRGRVVRRAGVGDVPRDRRFLFRPGAPGAPGQ